MENEQLIGFVYMARKFHWTKEDMGKLSEKEFNALLAELMYQEKHDEYLADYRAGAIMATIINCTPRRDNKTYKATDFVGQLPKRRDDSVSSTDLAKQRGLKVPKKEMNDG